MEGGAEGNVSVQSTLPQLTSHVPRSIAAPAPLDPQWVRIRRIAFAAYAAVLLAVVIIHGIPTETPALAAIVVSALLLTSVGRGWRASRQVVTDWLPFIAVLLLYNVTRGVADQLGMSLHEADVLRAEKWCFGGDEPTVWLQQHLYRPNHVYWYDVCCTLVYTSHFLVTPILAAALWLRARAVWLHYISRVVLLSLIGLITYCLFPEAPPWMAANDGLSTPVARLSARGWTSLHAPNLKAALAEAQSAGSNPVAAMPSLHIAFATLVAIVLVVRLRSRWRYLAALYPVAMGFTLVYCGEHYVLDLVVGVAYAFAVHLGLNRWERWRAARAAPGVPAGAPVAVSSGVSAP